MPEAHALADNPTAELSPQRAWAWALGICAIFFLAVAPTLSWLEFSGGSENLNAATVLEMNRGGPWLVPTLKEKPRLAKPPLTAWTTATFVSADTVKQLDSQNAAVRDSAYRDLAWQIRWPTLVLCCITILGTFEMTRLLAGPRAGLVAIIFFAGALMTLRFGRAATTDVQLMTWVTLSIVALLHALLRNRWWVGCSLAGLFLGLAFMAKGPVAFVQVIAPLIIARLLLRRSGLPKVRWLPLILGLMLMLVVGLPWYLLQFNIHGLAVLELWKVEVTREGATDLGRDPPWAYLSFFLLLMPWMPLAIAGLIGTAEAWKLNTPQKRQLIIGACLMLVPLIIMSCFKDKNERYTLPMTAAACALMAMVAAPVLRRDPGLKPAHRFVVDLTFALPPVVAILLAVGGAIGGSVGDLLTLNRADGSPWHSPVVAVLAATAALAATLLGHSMRESQPLSRPLAGFVVMLITGALFVHGYSRDLRGLSEFRATAFHLRDTYGTVPIFSVKNPADKIPHDLNIYLNRVVKEVDSLDLVPANALLIQIRNNDANPFIPPAGWELLESRPAGRKISYIARKISA